MFKTIILTVTILFSVVSIGLANPVYKVSGLSLNASLKIESFSTKAKAQEYAKKVDGQVFKEQGQELYRVIWGNFKINDVVIISSVE